MTRLLDVLMVALIGVAYVHTLFWPHTDRQVAELTLSFAAFAAVIVVGIKQRGDDR